MAKKPVSLSKGASKKSVSDEFDDEDTSEDEFEEIEEETPAMSTKDKDPEGHASAATPEQREQLKDFHDRREQELAERTAAKLKADEAEHQKVRDQLDKDNEQRKKEEEQAAAKAAKEEQAQQAKQDAEMHKAAR